MVSRTFSLPDQVVFAELSGDFNPLHVDPVAARRTMLGRAIVHGIHQLLWALDYEIEAPVCLRKLKVIFSAPIGVDEPIVCNVTHRGDSSLEIVLTSDHSKTCTIKLQYAKTRESWIVPAHLSERIPCEDIPQSQIPSAAGVLEIACDPMKMAALFPRLSQMLPMDQIAFLLATTRLVGMECPGLHSIYSELSLDFEANLDHDVPAMEWRVDQFDERFGQVLMSVSGLGVVGTITTYVRPQPQAQPSAEEIRSHVPVDAFADQKALVIGGSRGIGETCAKILALGGADVHITYHLGAEDAIRVVDEIAQHGRAKASYLNVRSPPAELEECLGVGWIPTHVYYFATPSISPGARGKFSIALFDRFCVFYVEGFARLYQGLRKLTRSPLELFYPSSVYVDAVPANFGEYAAAKAAGEALCRFFEAGDTHARIKIERLPRLPTDQTANLQNVSSSEPVEVLTRILLNAYGKEGSTLSR